MTKNETTTNKIGVILSLLFYISIGIIVLFMLVDLMFISISNFQPPRNGFLIIAGISTFLYFLASFIPKNDKMK